MCKAKSLSLVSFASLAAGSGDLSSEEEPLESGTVSLTSPVEDQAGWWAREAGAAASVPEHDPIQRLFSCLRIEIGVAGRAMPSLQRRPYGSAAPSGSRLLPPPPLDGDSANETWRISGDTGLAGGFEGVPRRE